MNGVASVDVTILHNPRCSKSRASLELVPDAHVVKYLDEPLDREAVLQLLAELEDSPSDLVRRDPLFHELGLTNADVESAEQVADLLSAHPQLMERPVIIRGNAAIIGRPTERIAAFLAD